MEKELLSISETAKMLGVSIDTLRRWDKSGRLPSFRSTSTSHRYYRREDIKLFLEDMTALVRRWVSSKHGNEPKEIFYCKNSDIFKNSLEEIKLELERVPNLKVSHFLIVAVAGEIGNNSYDHNLGNWPDIPGIFFGIDLSRRQIVLADRGQGVLRTLQRVRPELADEAHAIDIAFTERISARSLEARGNGLKFVRKVVTENPLDLFFQSGNAQLQLKENDSKLNITTASTAIHGTLAIIKF